MIDVESLSKQFTTPVDGNINVRVSRNGRKATIEVPRESVSYLKSLVASEEYGIEIRPHGGVVTTEEEIGVGTRQTPVVGSFRVLKKTSEGQAVDIHVVKAKDPKKRILHWL